MCNLNKLRTKKTCSILYVKEKPHCHCSEENLSVLQFLYQWFLHRSIWCADSAPSWKLQGNTWKFQWTESKNPYRSHFPLVTSVWEHIRTIKPGFDGVYRDQGMDLFEHRLPKTVLVNHRFHVSFPYWNGYFRGIPQFQTDPTSIIGWLYPHISPCSTLESWVLHGLSIFFIPC